MKVRNFSSSSPAGVIAPGVTERYELTELVGLLKRERRLIGKIVAAFMALAVAYALFGTRYYTATNTILIDPKRLQLFRQESVTADPILDSSIIETQLESLKSERVIIAAIRKLKLHEDPEFIKGSFNPAAILIDAVKNMLSAVDNSDEVRIRKAVLVFKGRLDVRRNGLSYAINVNFTAWTAEKAAAIANEVAEAYVADQLDAKFQVTQQAGAWLQGHIQELESRANDAERKLLAFKAKNQIIDANGRLVNEQQLTDLSSQLGAARQTTAEAKARLDRLRDVIREGIADASVTDALRNEVLIKLRQEYLEAVRREQDWSARFGAGHGASIRVRADAARLKNAMDAELRRIEQTYLSDYEIAKSREASTQKEMLAMTQKWAGVREAQVKLRELEGAAQSYRTLHDSLVQRYLSTMQQQTLPVSDARVITVATKPGSPSWPRNGLILAGALIGGLGVGASVVVAREIFDRKIRNSGQIAELTHCEFFGPLPLEPAPDAFIASPEDASSETVVVVRESGAQSFNICHTRSDLWAILRNPFSPFAETLRNVQVAIDERRMLHPLQIVALISSNPSEGKTTTACNFTLGIARSGRSVLLIDADLRKPQLTQSLCHDAELGLLEALSGACSLRDAIWQEQVTGCCFLPTVLHTKQYATTQLLASDAMAKLLREAAEMFDYVIVDTAPVARLADVRAFSHFVDAFVLATAWGETTRVDVERVATAEHIQGKLLGTVMTKVRLGDLSIYNSGSAGYYD